MRSGPVRSGAVRICDEQWSSVYCACHARLCVCVRLAARQKAAAGQRRPSRRSSALKCCVRLAATQKAAAGQRRPRAPQLCQEALCTAPATQKAAAGQRRPRAPQLRQEALCTAPATHIRQPRASGAHARRSSASIGSVYCACHAYKAATHHRRPRAPQLRQQAHARRSSARRLCVLRPQNANICTLGT